MHPLPQSRISVIRAYIELYSKIITYLMCIPVSMTKYGMVSNINHLDASKIFTMLTISNSRKNNSYEARI